MMKFIRTGFAVLFAVVTAAFLYFYVTEKISKDRTIPVITVDGEMLELSVSDDKSAMFKGVTASDGKDGDLTDSIIIESISKFMKPGICKVQYAVCDSDDHVASVTRKIRYTDYTKPVITLNRSLCFNVSEYIDVTEIIGATDCIDGNITSSVRVTSDDYIDRTEGQYHLTVKVTNSKDDTVMYTLPLFVDKKIDGAPLINLRTPLVYLKKDASFSPEDYVISVIDSAMTNITDTLRMEDDVNMSEPGVYAAHYYAVDAAGRQGHNVLIIIVEE